MYGGLPLTSASTTSATCGLLTRRMVATSWASRFLAVSSAATPCLSTLIATSPSALSLAR